MQPDLDLREKRKRKWSERQNEETSLQFKKQSLERELEDEKRTKELTTERLKKDLQEKEKQLRMTEKSFRELLHLVKDEKESVAQFDYLKPQLGLCIQSILLCILMYLFYRFIRWRCSCSRKELISSVGGKFLQMEEIWIPGSMPSRSSLQGHQNGHYCISWW